MGTKGLIQRYMNIRGNIQNKKAKTPRKIGLLVLPSKTQKSPNSPKSPNLLIQIIHAKKCSIRLGTKTLLDFPKLGIFKKGNILK